jgi:hypothetical protein
LASACELPQPTIRKPTNPATAIESPNLDKFAVLEDITIEFLEESPNITQEQIEIIHGLWLIVPSKPSAIKIRPQKKISRPYRDHTLTQSLNGTISHF